MKHLVSLKKSNTGTNESTVGENSNFNSYNQKPSLNGNENVCINNSYNDRLSDSTVYSLSGLTVDKACDLSQGVFKNHSIHDVAILQVGTCDVQRDTLTNLTKKYDKLIQSVSQTAPSSKVVITAIPPRLSDGYASVNEKTNKFNAYLQKLCSNSKQLYFIDANPPKHRTNYREDGYYFSQAGTSFYARFASNYITHSLNFPLQHLSKML